MDKELTPDGNPDIRVSKNMKMVVGQRTWRVVVEEEETDVGEKKSTAKDVGSTEEDAAESVLPRGEEETINPSAWTPKKRYRKDKETPRSSISATSLEGRGFSRYGPA
ncbi:hypothetical protein NDU88_003907 [Pleurodeles waltl]|uniref:Uncharacterized protein n=1 Tax=Pleurodeles waltl TaxID=8319 RepID=A0AAV7MRX4_PLEWA|nr:hypothetical protein NDU88_003907 [Pleurodeles waltl]